MTQWRLNPDGFSVEFTGSQGTNYQLQRASATPAADWVDVGTPATGTTVTLTDPAPLPVSAFYRVAAR